MATMANEKQINEFLTNYSELEIIHKQLVSYAYLESLNDDFLYNNYLTHWPIDLKNSDNINLEDQVSILNLNLKFANSQLS
jgi:hypothetical protein